MNKTEGYSPLPVVGGGTRGMWLGVNGPSVHIGPMRRFLSQGSRGLVASVRRAIVADKQRSVRESKPERNWVVHRHHRELTVCVLLSYRAHTWCTMPSPSWRAIGWSRKPSTPSLRRFTASPSIDLPPRRLTTSSPHHLHTTPHRVTTSIIDQYPRHLPQTRHCYPHPSRPLS